MDSRPGARLASRRITSNPCTADAGIQKEDTVYVVVQHRIKDPQAAFSRAENIVEDAPPGVRARQFFSSRDLSAATCLWEADSVEAVRNYVDSTLAESSENHYFEVDTERAFGLPERVTTGA
jgi:hypothetical protein